MISGLTFDNLSINGNQYKYSSRAPCLSPQGSTRAYPFCRDKAHMSAYNTLYLNES